MQIKASTHIQSRIKVASQMAAQAVPLQVVSATRPAHLQNVKIETDAADASATAKPRQSFLQRYVREKL